MKSSWKKTSLLGCMFILISLSSIAQCSNTLQSITYDTLIPGTGNDTRVFSLPQLNPILGTLVSVKINATVSLNYGFSLENVNAVPVNYSISVGRYDNYSGSAISPSYSNLNTIPLGSFLVNPGATVSQAPSTILYRYQNSDSIVANVAPFLGNGTVSFNYKSITYTNLTGSSLYSYSVAVNDTVDFSITYYYCNITVLATDILDFTATKTGNQQVILNWTHTNESPGTQIEIQKSSDGQVFVPIASLESIHTAIQNETYHYDYPLAAEDKNKIYFRLKLKGSDESVQYSEIRELNLNEGDGLFTIYPNPSEDYINIAFNQPVFKNWQLDIFAANGNLMQTNYASNTNITHLSFARKLAAGVYFVKLTDQQTLQSHVLSFMVH